MSEYDYDYRYYTIPPIQRVIISCYFFKRKLYNDDDKIIPIPPNFNNVLTFNQEEDMLEKICRYFGSLSDLYKILYYYPYRSKEIKLTFNINDFETYTIIKDFTNQHISNIKKKHNTIDFLTIKNGTSSYSHNISIHIKTYNNSDKLSSSRFKYNLCLNFISKLNEILKNNNIELPCEKLSTQKKTVPIREVNIDGKYAVYVYYTTFNQLLYLNSKDFELLHKRLSNEDKYILLHHANSFLSKADRTANFSQQLLKEDIELNMEILNK